MNHISAVTWVCLFFRVTPIYVPRVKLNEFFLLRQNLYPLSVLIIGQQIRNNVSFLTFPDMFIMVMGQMKFGIKSKVNSWADIILIL